jgi:hypothetical protein
LSSFPFGIKLGGGGEILGENDEFYFKANTLGNIEDKSDLSSETREEHDISHDSHQRRFVLSYRKCLCYSAWALQLCTSK